MFGPFTHDVIHLGFVVHHDEHAEKVHECRKYAHQHDARVGHTGQLGHDEPAGPHDGGHEHAADGGRRFDAAGDVGPESGLFHHRDGKCSRGDRIGDGTAGNGTEQAASDNGHLGRSADFVPHRGQGPVDEKFLGAALFQEGAEQDEQDHVGGQHVGHDAENPVAHVVDGGAQVGKGFTRMGKQVRGIGAEHAV